MSLVRTTLTCVRHPILIIVCQFLGKIVQKSLQVCGSTIHLRTVLHKAYIIVVAHKLFSVAGYCLPFLRK